jgi:polyphosphate kinase
LEAFEGSPIIQALTEAARRGKQVVVLVEITARFDEAPNIVWGEQLEKAGAHVEYGMERLKTHVKLGLVVREEPDGLRQYVHVSTGNYHNVTARLYEDLGLLSCETEAHMRYLRELVLPHPAMKVILEDYLMAISAAQERIQRCETAMIDRLSSLGVYEGDNTSAWDMQPDGHYVRRRPGADQPRRSRHRLKALLLRHGYRYHASRFQTAPQP